MKPPSTATRDSPISTTRKTSSSNTRASVQGNARRLTAFAYSHASRSGPIRNPHSTLLRTCLEGYDTFYFDKNILIDAYDKCREVCGYEG